MNRYELWEPVKLPSIQLDLSTESIDKRYLDLAKIIHSAFDIHFQNPELYGNELLKWIGQFIIRSYPGIDRPLTSIDANELAIENGYDSLFHVTDAEVKRKEKQLLAKNKNQKQLRKDGLIRYEHLTPISYFVYLPFIESNNPHNLAVDEYYQELKKHHKVVWLTGQEYYDLNKNNKLKRNSKVLADLGIKILGE